MKRHYYKKAKYYGGVKLKDPNPVGNSLEESSSHFNYSSNTTTNTNTPKLNIPQLNIPTFNKPTQSSSHNNSQIVQNNNTSFHSKNPKPKSNKKVKSGSVPTESITHVKTSQSNNQNPTFQTQEPILLENEWTIWFDNFKGQAFTAEAYLNSMVPLGTFGTIQVSFKNCNNLKSFFFKKGILEIFQFSP